MSALLLVSFIWIFPVSVSAQIGWLWNWKHRKPIVITGSTAGAQTNYQIKVTVGFAAGKMNADFSDIRFTSADGAAQLDYWRESYTASSTADFWVEVPSIPASPSTVVIHLYYGSPSAAYTGGYFSTFDVLGDGAGGPLTVSAANTVVNNYTYLTGSESAGDSVIAVNSGAAFSNGDEILIVRMKDAAGGSAGTYEFRKISSGGGTGTLTLSAPLKNSYDAVTQVVRVPRYMSVTVNSGASIAASAWDGNQGGIAAFRASGTVSVAGSIDVSSAGFLNGETYKGNTMYGGGGGGGYESGAGYLGYDGGGGGATGGAGGTHGATGPAGVGGSGGNGGGANGGAGGGGNTHVNANCGGGGGGGGGGGNFYGLGGLGGGGGGHGACATGTAGGNGGTTSGSNANGGNGGGGYGTNGTGGKGGAGEYASAAWYGSDGTASGGGNGAGGIYDYNYGYLADGGGGGAAGLAYGSADLSAIFLGTPGGNVLANTGAGGIIIVFANTLAVTGTVSSNGSNASGQIGGSSGGSVYLTGASVTVGSSLVSAVGGAAWARPAAEAREARAASA